jgi:hypothetical protein
MVSLDMYAAKASRLGNPGKIVQFADFTQHRTGSSWVGVDSSSEGLHAEDAGTAVCIAFQAVVPESSFLPRKSRTKNPIFVQQGGV